MSQSTALAGLEPVSSVAAVTHLTAVEDLSDGDLRAVLDLGHAVKSRPAEFAEALRGRSMAMIFEKSSTRTRVSFEVGLHQLGGHAVFLSSDDTQLGRGETIADTARVLSRYVDLIMARTYSHQDLLELAENATVPVINALTDERHPCQALADVMTLEEVFGDDLVGRRLAWIGDGNNVAHSLILAAARMGLEVVVASPEGFGPEDDIVERARAWAAPHGQSVAVVRDPMDAADGASVLATDVWTSMGHEEERERRLRAFEGYTVDEAMFGPARSEAVFLHCLPCHRGEEVAAEVVDGPRSVVLDEAENRMHVQKAVMLHLLGQDV